MWANMKTFDHWLKGLLLADWHILGLTAICDSWMCHSAENCDFWGADSRKTPTVSAHGICLCQTVKPSRLPACPSLSQLGSSLIASAACLKWLVYGTVLCDIALYIMFQSSWPWGLCCQQLVHALMSTLWWALGPCPNFLIQTQASVVPLDTLWSLSRTGPCVIIPDHPHWDGRLATTLAWLFFHALILAMLHIRV